MKILALDVGEKTIGTAFCEESLRLAFPGETILRQEGHRRDMARLRQLIADHQVSRIVVGMPLMLDGTHGVQVEKIEAFIRVLRNSVRIPIVTQDERLTTWEADRMLIAADRNRKERKQVVDSLAACLILQSWLDRQQALENTRVETTLLETTVPESAEA